MFFMFMHNSCTLNGDHLGLTIKTSNTQQERMLSQTIINTVKEYKGWERIEKIKSDAGG